MSLSWNGEQHNPSSSFDVCAKDMKLKTYADDDYEHIINDASNWRPPQPQKPVVTEYRPNTTREKKKSWLLRPISWLVFLLSVGLMNSIINTTFLLIDFIIKWLSTLPTMAVVLITLAFGSLVISLMVNYTIKLVVFVVMGAQAIYPSKNGVRYYIVGASQVLISLLSTVLTIADASSSHTFLDFAAPIYFAIMYTVMLCNTKYIID